MTRTLALGAVVALTLACGPNTSSMGGTDSATSGESESESQTSTSGSTTGVDPPAMTCSDLRERFMVSDVAVYEDGAVVGGQLDQDVEVSRLDADDHAVWSWFHTGGAQETIEGDVLGSIVVTPSGSIVVAGHDAMGIYEYFDIDVPIMVDAKRWFVFSFDADGQQEWVVMDPAWVPFDAGETPARVSSIIDSDHGEIGGTVHLVEVGVQQGFEVQFVTEAGDLLGSTDQDGFILKNIATSADPFTIYTAGVDLSGYHVVRGDGAGCDLEGSFLWGDLAAGPTSAAAAFTSNYADLNKVAELLVKDAEGNLAWQASYDPTALMDFAFAVGIDPAGNVAVAGSIGYDGEGAPSDARAWVRLYDPSGSELWTVEHDEPSGVFRALDIAENGDIALVGDWNFEQSRICWLRS